jgi:hypothetical protein
MKESSDNREFARSQLSHLIGRSDDVELTYQDLNASHNPRGQLTTSERVYMISCPKVTSDIGPLTASSVACSASSSQLAGILYLFPGLDGADSPHEFLIQLSL